jgi:LysM repeat protein
MFAHFFAGCLIALAGIPATATPYAAATRGAAAFPDIVMPGTRGIKVELQIDAQVLIDHCCVQHVVTKGDTLAKIAANHRKHLMTGNTGSLDRIQETTVKDILTLNPGLNPDKLVINQRIWMPPRIPAAIKTENTFVFIDQLGPFFSGGTDRGFAPTDKMIARRRANTVFWLVPASQMEIYTKVKQARRWQEIESLKKSGKVQTLMTSRSAHTVWDESPVHSCKDTITIERSKEGVLSAKLTSVAYNKAGEVVSPTERIKDHRKNKSGMWFLLLPFFGGGWLLWRSRRQISPIQNTPAMLGTA